MSKETKTDVIGIHIHCPGDSSVGIWPTSYEAMLTIDADFFDDAEYKAQFVEAFKKLLEDFTDGGRAITTEELESLNAIEAAIDRQESGLD